MSLIIICFAKLSKNVNFSIVLLVKAMLLLCIYIKKKYAKFLDYEKLNDQDSVFIVEIDTKFYVNSP